MFKGREETYPLSGEMGKGGEAYLFKMGKRERKSTIWIWEKASYKTLPQKKNT